MSPVINKVGKLHNSGPKGRKRWRVKYWLGEEAKPSAQYFGKAEGSDRINRREAERQLARWLVEVGANPGKAVKIVLPTLKEHTDRYMASIRPRYAISTMDTIRYTIDLMHRHFMPDYRIDRITPDEADRFFSYLVDRGLADATLRHHLENVKAIMRSAVNRYPDQIRFNPFKHIKIKPEPSRGTWKQVTYADAIAAIDACTAQYTSRTGWQVFIALQRFAGLRKGEALALLKQDVNLTAEPMLIKVDGSKTARSTGERYRVVPVLFPILGQLLVRAIGESEPSDPFVVSTKVARGRGAQRTTMHRIFKRAGIEPWRPTFKVLRPSCEYDFLKLGLPEAIYTRAIGHSPEVSRRYYLAKFQGVNPDEFTRERYQEAAKRVEEMYPV